MAKTKLTFFYNKLFALFALCSVVHALCGCAATGYTEFPATAVFSGDILFTAKIAGGHADIAHKRMTSIIEEIDFQASATRVGGDLFRFNGASAGERVEVGKHCYELFLLSKKYYELTGGAFNCAALPLSELWGLNAGDIAEPGSKVSDLPTINEVESANEYCDPTLATAIADGGRYYLVKRDERVKLDFGGIAKGYAADRCADILREYNIASALIDISGNAYFYGEYIGGDGKWHVGISSPRPRAGDILDVSRGVVAALNIDADSSAVTSGDYMRYYVCDANGETVYVPHILGASGAPVGVYYDETSSVWRNSDEYVISATVIGKNSAECDALSTAVAALGLERGAELLQKVGCKGLIFTEKRYTIVGDAELYKPDVYDGFEAYEFYGG